MIIKKSRLIVGESHKEQIDNLVAELQADIMKVCERAIFRQYAISHKEADRQGLMECVKGQDFFALVDRKTKKTIVMVRKMTYEFEGDLLTVNANIGVW